MHGPASGCLVVIRKWKHGLLDAAVMFRQSKSSFRSTVDFFCLVCAHSSILIEASLPRDANLYWFGKVAVALNSNEVVLDSDPLIASCIALHVNRLEMCGCRVNSLRKSQECIF